MNVQELMALAKVKAEEAKTEAEAGELEKSAALLVESTQAQAQATAVAEAEKIIAAVDQPVLPATLPVDEKTTGNPTMPGEPDTPTGDAAETALHNSFYIMRYGSVEKATRAVLTDLHGNDYEGKRMAQWEVFGRYLRQYDRPPSAEEAALLKEIILTPEYAQEAIKTGMDMPFIKATMVEAIDDLGGYVVPVDFQLEVVRRIAGFTVMRPRARVQTTSRDKVDIPRMTGGDDQFTTAVRVTWVSETPTAGTADTNLTFALDSIPINDVMAETFLSRNVVEDSAFNLIRELTIAFAEAAAINEDNEFLTGDGVGKPEGILIGTVPKTGVTAVASGNATDITADGMIDLEYEIASQYRSNCVFIAARKTVRNMRKLKGGDGHYLWGNADLAGEPGTFDGFPVIEQEVMPAIAASAYPILFGDPTAYRIVDRIGMTVERYLDSATARQNLVLYIMRRRLGGKLVQPERFVAQQISV